MINEKIQKAFNAQINAETFSAYLYLSMAAYFEELNLPGFGNWMKIQAQEEMVHAMKFYTFIIERGGRVLLDAIKKPETAWDSPLAAFQAGYAHEQYITNRINKLVDLALETSDHASKTFLDWFVTEQVEEESNSDNIGKQLKLIEGSPQALFMLDRELAARVFTPPAAPAK